ncbi:MAG: CdvA-like protein [Candidatus Bathyarchaeota archaeon]|nr:CdvA-like protein [Candidatus Bathyarchaeota archaeon]
MSTPNLFLSLGKPVKNEYGKIIGKIASFTLTPNGKFDAVFIEFGNGKFSKMPIEHLKVVGSEITFLSKIKTQALMLCDQIPLIWRKDQAAKEAMEKHRIPAEVYEELHVSFENALEQLKKDAQVTTDEATIEIDNCNEALKALNYALANLEIEHGIGQIDDDTYKTSSAMLLDNQKRITAEKADLEAMKSKIASTLLGDISPPPETSPPKTNKVYAETVSTTNANQSTNTKTDLPEPPVVVYVKDVGKSGL